jgi:hypothetical protein
MQCALSEFDDLYGVWKQFDDGIDLGVGNIDVFMMFLQMRYFRTMYFPLCTRREHANAWLMEVVVQVVMEIIQIFHLWKHLWLQCYRNERTLKWPYCVGYKHWTSLRTTKISCIENESC